MTKTLPPAASVKRPRLLIVHSDIGAFGGAEFVALRIAEAMQNDFESVTIMHSGKALDCDVIQARFDLRLDPRKVAFDCVPIAALLPAKLGNWALIRYALALRRAARVAHEFDTVVTTYGECPFDHPRAAQYIHYPLFFGDRVALERLGARVREGLHAFTRELYVSLARRIAKWNAIGIRQHTVIANSHWTAGEFRERYGEAYCHVAYPGASIALNSAELPSFESRSNEFVVLGRIVAGKRLELAVEIVRRLREAHGLDVRLNIVGNVSRAYRKHLRKLLRAGSWVSWHAGMSRREMERFISTRKWGLHCFPFEHYGIAPAELQRLGCLVFVPDEGGQREIVTQPELRYRGVADAVEKIARVLGEPSRHAELLAQAQVDNQLHDAGRFSDVVRQLVRNLPRREI